MPSLRFRSNRSFFLRVALPVLLVTISALAMANYSLKWASESIDQAAEKRQGGLIIMVVNKLKDRIAHDQESVTIWDDAVINTTQKPDLEWIDSNLGTWMHSYFGHDELYVIDGDDKPIYAFRQDGVVAPERFSTVAPITVPMAERFRERLRQATSVAESEKGKTKGLAEFVFVNQRPAILSLKPILPDSGAPELMPVRGQEHLHVALRYLDGDVLKEIGDDYRISSLRFSKRLPESNQTASADLRTGSGGFLGYFIWDPIRPGSDFMQQIRPVIYAINSAVFILVLAMLGIQFFRMKADERNRKRIEFLALHDNLTGLPNRHSFDRDLDSLLKAANVSTISVGFLDLDRFKLVNDTLGHEAGDYVIAEAGRRIKVQLGADGFLYRIGGDEFMIIALVPIRSMLSIAERIVISVEQPMHYSDNLIQVGVSIGIACWPEHGADRTTLARKADRALYSAKGTGRGRAVLFVPKMDAEITSEQPVRDDLRRSLAQSSGLSVTLRPVTSRDTDDIIAVDMDLQWDHPEHGSFATRNLFDKIANDHGLIDTLGRHVFSEAIQLAPQIPYARIIVPISKQQLRQPSFPLVLTSMLEKTRLQPAGFALDFGECASLCEEPECQKTIGLLKQVGFHMVAGGLPSQFFGFERLQKLGTDCLRIDAALVRAALADKGAETLVRAIIEIAKENRMAVLADGVDRIDSLLFLTGSGCDAFQGAICSADLGLADLVQRAGSGANSREIGIGRGI